MKSSLFPEKKKSFIQKLEESFAENRTKKPCTSSRHFTLFSNEILSWQKEGVKSVSNEQSDVYFTIGSGNLFWLLPDIYDKFKYFIIGDISAKFCYFEKIVMDFYVNSENGAEFLKKINEGIEGKKLTSIQREYFKQHLQNFPYDNQELFLKSRDILKKVLSENRLGIINLNVTDQEDAITFSKCLMEYNLKIKFFNITNVHTWVDSNEIYPFLEKLLSNDTIVCFASSVGGGEFGGYLSGVDFKGKIELLSKENMQSGLYKDIRKMKDSLIEQKASDVKKTLS